MNVNFSKPSFQGKIKVELDKKPEQIISILELSINPKVKMKEFKTNNDKLAYILETKDYLIPSLQKYLSNNNIKFDTIA